MFYLTVYVCLCVCLYVCLCISYYNAESHSFDVERYSSTEPAYVDQVKMLFDDCGEKKYRVSDVAARSDRLQRVFIMLRVEVIINSPTYLLTYILECIWCYFSFNLKIFTYTYTFTFFYIFFYLCFTFSILTLMFD